MTNPLFSIVGSIIILSIVAGIVKYPKLLFYLVSILFFTPIINLIPHMYGISNTLIVQMLLLFVMILILVSNKINIMELKFQKPIMYLYCFFLILLISNQYFGSGIRMTARSHTLPPLLWLTIISMTLIITSRYYNIRNNWLFYIKRIMWLDISMAGFTLFFGSTDMHTDLSVIQLPYFTLEYAINDLAIKAVIIMTLEYYCNINNNFKFLYIIKIAMLTLINLYCFSRGGTIVMVSALLALLYFNKKLNLVQIFVFSIMAIFVINIFPTEILVGRFREINFDLTETRRWILIQRTLLLFIANPIFGIGVGDFYQYRYTYSELAIGSYDDSHHLIGQIAAETGIIGLFIFFMFLKKYFHAISDNRAYKPDLYKLGLIFLVVFLLATNFSHNRYNMWFYFPMICIAWKDLYKIEENVNIKKE